MSNKLNSFEQQLKNVAEGHEVPYDASQWSALEKTLNSQGSAMNPWTKWGLVAAVIMLVGYGAVNVFQEDQVVLEKDNSERVSLEEQVVEIQVVAEQEEWIAEVKEETTEPVSDQPLEQPLRNEEAIQETSNEVKESGVNNNENLTSPTVTLNSTQSDEEIEDLEVTSIVAVEVPVVTLSNVEICAGMELTGSLSPGEYTEVTWFLGADKEVKGTELAHVFFEPGQYEIKAFVADIKEFTATTTVTVKPKPDASFRILNNLERGMIPVEYISANTGGEKSYSWSLGDGTHLNGEGVSHSYRKAGDYEISLRVLNKYGCFWTNYQRLTIEKEFNLLAPNSFSPNGDGVNDEWIPVALSSGYYNFELKIYDRNSNLIFESSDPGLSFDGKAHGTMASSGEIFIWKASTVDPNGVRQEYGGTMMSMY